ncbi:hypothetical protein GT755_06225 [Herbidospora sp. NEAU-GS84]|uniref:Uncharacterized protein n=1 Tax=Herbidospora solisilvae TaxID=2696284 RepID=A0A7C9JAU9_9ACTN|nr:hypothetical protein [Herbidospora solisilvae]
MEDSTFVQYYEFSITDHGGPGDPDAKSYDSSWNDRGVEPEWLVAADNMLMITSEFDGHRPRIRFEVWPSDPGPRHDAEVITTSFYVSSGSIAIDEMLTDTKNLAVELGPPKSNWNVRGHRTTLVPPDHFPEDADEELEAYLFQFWPGDPQAR